MEHKQAMIETINFAFPTILTSGTIMKMCIRDRCWATAAGTIS